MTLSAPAPSVDPTAPSPAKPATLAQCHEVIDTLGRELAQLREQLAWLQERMKLDSRNSSKPPSSDGPGGGCGGNRAQRRASGRSRGAQPGHKGSFRALLPEAEVQAVVEQLPPEVCECGGPVQRGKAWRHQVTDLPERVVAEVTEYRLYRGVCQHCRKTHATALPPGVPQGQIGPRALALIGVLGTSYHLTQGKITTLLGEVLGVRFSVGAVSQAQGAVAQALKAPVQAAAASCRSAPVLHLDETSWRQQGSSHRHWVWAVVQPQLVVYQILPSRARYVAQSLVGEQPTATLVTDRYAVYDWVDTAQRQVCWAHLLRDFKRIGERPGQAGRTGRWLYALGLAMFRRHHRQDPTDAFESIQRRVKRTLQAGAAGSCRRTAQTCANVLNLEPALWRFLHAPGVSPTNNAAEQALRTLVLKRKISGPTRSPRGQQFVAWGYTLAESCRRQGRDVLHTMEHAVRAWLGGAPALSLLPASG